MQTFFDFFSHQTYRTPTAGEVAIKGWPGLGGHEACLILVRALLLTPCGI